MRSITPTLALPATAQLQALVELFQQALGASLAGIILHGSAATSGFDPAHSDLDLLVIVTRALSPGQYQALGMALLRISGRPHPVELSVVTQATLAQWTHPCSYEFHYGESQRVRFAAGQFVPQYADDGDLAAHLTVAKARGVDLLGTYPPAQLPDIPRTDYLAALLSDFGWAADQAENLDDYVLANACRTLAYLQTGEILSKTEGVDWCCEHAVDMSTVVAAVVSALRRARQDEQAITTA
jgi:hypothetical protein